MIAQCFTNDCRCQTLNGRRFVGWLTVLLAVVVSIPVLAADESQENLTQRKDVCVSIFNGKDLTGWDGAQGLWRVVDGLLVGETSEEIPLSHHSYLIWRDGEVEDFELRLKFRLTGRRGNSGVQYRSRDLGDHDVAGYQYNMPATRVGATAVLEEMKNGRGGHLAEIGQRVRLLPGGERKVIGSTGEADQINASYQRGDWNDLTIRAEGHRIRHWLNGHLAVDAIDEEKEKFSARGLLAFQLHSGPPMKIELKQIRLQTLAPNQTSSARNAPANATQPNIVFILADDLGYWDLGCYDCPDIRTPHLDRLAEEGLRFTDFYANCSVCSPTLAAFMTGRYQHRIGMEHAVYYQENGKGLPPEGETIADAMKSAGYGTGLCGKWHLGYDFERRPMQQGFDHFFGLLGGNHHYFQHMDRVGVHDLWLGNKAVKREGYSTDLITDNAIAFLDQHQKKSFFLYLSHPAPHFPWQGPGDADKLVEPKKPTWQQGDRHTYVAMVEHMDQRIGDVLAKLKELGLQENTLVVFTSDNGGHTWSRNAPLRDYKGTRWEGGTRVPCIVRWPSVIKAGVTTEQVGITIDWTATFRDLAGLPVDSNREDGISLLPTLNSPAKSVMVRSSGDVDQAKDARK